MPWCPDGETDGEDGEGDDAGNDEGKGGGEERLERAGVGLGRLLAPVTAVHSAAEEPGASGAAVLILSSQQLAGNMLDNFPTSLTRLVM